MSLATIECLNQTWVAEEDGDTRRHKEIAAAAYSKRTPFCRQHKSSKHKISSVFPPIYDTVGSIFDLSTDTDILVVRHDLDIDPFEELEELQEFGRKIILKSGLLVPDFGNLDRVDRIGRKNHPYNTNAELTISEIDDLVIASNSLTNMILKQHND